MSRVISLYDPLTGFFTGRQRSGPSLEFLLRNVPKGLAAVEGNYDRFRNRVDLVTGEVIDDGSLAAGRDAGRRRVATLARIAQLEESQARPLRELAIDPANAEAHRRLNEIDAQIAELRKDAVR